MKNSLLAGSGEIRSRGCFFVGRVAKSQLTGAGKQRSHPVTNGDAFILIVYNPWNKDEIPPNQAAQRGCSSQKCLI